MTKKTIKLIRLSESESIQIRESLKTQGLSIIDLAEKIGVDRTYIYQIFSGRRNIQPEHAFQIYQNLDQDPSVSFLISKYSDPKKARECIPLVDQKWLELYSEYISQLRRSFLKQSTDGRGQIIHELEKLAAQYTIHAEEQADKDKTE